VGVYGCSEDSSDVNPTVSSSRGGFKGGSMLNTMFAFDSIFSFFIDAVGGAGLLTFFRKTF
jgi:hypothetical protein